MNPSTHIRPGALTQPARRLVALLLLVASLARPQAADTPTAPTIGLKLLTEGLGAPIALAPLPDGSGRLLLAEQGGVIHLLDRNGARAEAHFLNLRPKMVTLGDGMEERGLLGLALHPRFKTNRKFYLVYSVPRRPTAPPAWDHTQRLSEFTATDPQFTTADPASERVVFEIDQPDWNHNSGRLAFGPDGFLYMTVGDGGAFNDVGDVARGRGHPPEGNGQRLDTHLGKVLRLDIDGGTPYRIPSDNPYADGKTGRPEIYAYGLRNPWGMSFDRGGNHDLIVVDVGQDRWEEINVIVKGGNYGWRLREGFDGFDPNKPNQAPTNAVTVGADGKPFIDPVFTYKTLRGRTPDPTAYGVTITGGYVYRGKALPELAGKYVFADWSRHMGIPDGTLLVATIPPAGSTTTRWSAEPLAVAGFSQGRIKSYIWALGEDADGELYVLANGINSVTNTRGKLYKLVRQ